jgi:hypothetical protein
MDVERSRDWHCLTPRAPAAFPRIRNGMDRRPVVNDMDSRREREEELRGLLQTPQGMETIIKLYHH